MFWIGGLPWRFSASSFCDFWIITFYNFTAFFSFLTKHPFDFSDVIHKEYYTLGPKKKFVMLPLPDQNLKIGSVGRDFFFFFFFFLRTVRELSFPIFFLKFLNGENSGGMQSKRIYKSCKCFFKPLNTNFSKSFAQIWHKTKKKKKNNPTLFFRILRSVGRGQHNIFLGGPYLCPNMINLNVVDFSECRSEEVMFLLTLSVHNTFISWTWRWHQGDISIQSLDRSYVHTTWL